MANIGQIVAEITATTAGLRRAQQDANKQFGQIQGEANATGKVVKMAFAVAAVAAVAAFTKELYKCYQGANETKKAMLGLESTAKAFGQNFEDASKSVKELYSDGIMPLDKSIRGFKNLLSVGFSVEEAMQISKSLKDIGAFNNVVGDLGQAFEDSTKGLKTGSMELIENIGLTQRLSAVMKQAQQQAIASGDAEKARQLDVSNGIDITNNAAQRMAVYNAILKEGAKFEGDAAKLANDNASANAKLSATWKEMSDNLGNRVSPAFANVIGLATEMTKAVSDFLKESNFSKVTKQLEEQQTQLYGLQAVYLQLKEKTSLTATEQEVYNETIKKLQDMFPDFLKNIDLQNIKYSDAVSVMKQLNSEMEKKILMEESAAAIKDSSEKIVESFKKEKKAYDDLVIARGQLKKAQDRYGTSFSAGMDVVNWAQEVENYEKAIENEKRYREDIKNGIKYTQNYYSELLKMADAKKKTFYVQPSNIYNTYDPDAEKFVPTTKTGDEKFKPDTEKTLAQKKAELEYKKQLDLANAKEEEKYLIQLKHKTALAVLDAEDKYNKAIAGAKNQKEAKKAMDELIASVGKLEVDLKIKEKSIDYAKNALGLTNLEGYGVNVPIKLDGMQEAAEILLYEYQNTIDEMATEFLKKLKNAESAVGLTDVSNYGVPKPEPKPKDDGLSEEEKAEKELNEAINTTISSFNALANELDNNFMKVLANVAESAMSLKGSYGAFTAGQKEGGLLGGLGMLSGGIGMFTSAVSIFQGVGGLFHKSTYNFDEAVKKMLKGIGEKAPEVQAKEYEKILGLKEYLSEQGLSDKRYTQLTKEQADAIKALGFNVTETIQVDSGHSAATGAIKTVYTLGKESSEMLGALEKIIPQLAEQLGTTAKEFGSDIASALSNASTFTAFSDNLEDNVFSSVKSGLIAAFLASETMKPLLDNLQQSMTIAVADGVLSTEPSNDELSNLKNQVAEIEKIAQPFYDALESVGFNLVDASDDMKSASDALSSTINRNLRLAEKIQKDQTGTSQIVNIDFTGANLGGVSEASMINLMNRATAQSNIAKTGVR